MKQIKLTLQIKIILTMVLLVYQKKIVQLLIQKLVEYILKSGVEMNGCSM